ncbi:DNA-directed RNA polymerase specialized sigma54-like protein [Neobacillus ginsengisoli]|uniref:DNA-directed RNA polymerase specialized sigma54-like protein n=1 Tax=Neobacillus ginsengisoli TaxID=904295 RepID=A0ABT9XUZ8_9BACI|nr:DNA-directed RNA polymerase specialized sigma54-like protein [Neobacillus ginsengisoli]
MHKKNNIVKLKTYKKLKKRKNKRGYVLLSVYLSIVSVLYAFLYFNVKSHDTLDIKTFTETHAFLYK